MGQLRKDRELFWRGVLQRQAESDLSVAGFCRQESISAPSFYAWRRKLGEPDVMSSQVHDDHASTVSSGQLLPVRIESSPSSLPVKKTSPAFIWQFGNFDTCLDCQMKAGVIFLRSRS